MEPVENESEKVENKSNYSSGYGKRPIWQWVLIYLVIGGIVYYAIYYFAYAKKGNSYSPTPTGSAPAKSLY